MGTETPAMGFTVFTPLAAILFFTMITTLRFSITGTLKTANPMLRLLTHPLWLAPLVLTGGATLGAFYHGALSPWPPATFADISRRFGLWGGVAATEAVVTADIWLLWATATTFKVFSPPDDARMVKYYYAVNLVIGSYLLARFLHILDMGQVGIIPG